MHQTKRKQHITLIEIMIVMFLIALIAGVVAYNYRGSLDEGRAFQTKQNIEKIKSILELELAKERTPDYNKLRTDWKSYIGKSPLVKDKDALVQDGWGNALEIAVDVPTQTFRIFSISQFCSTAGNADKCGQPEDVPGITPVPRPFSR